jgi:hypothetical protein
MLLSVGLLIFGVLTDALLLKYGPRWIAAGKPERVTIRDYTVIGAMAIGAYAAIFGVIGLTLQLRQ